MYLYVYVLYLQAWWITDTISTDLWGKWEMVNKAWHYTNLKDYPEGKPYFFMNEIGDLRTDIFVTTKFK